MMKTKPHPPLPKIPVIKLSEKTIVVVGLPATGKTTVTEAILTNYKDRKIKVFRTDDYIKYGFEKSLYVLMDHLRKDISPIRLIEGVQGYRLLRKGVELGTFLPDLVIVCVADTATRQTRFLQRPPKDTGTGTKRHKGFDAMLTKIFDDYVQSLTRLKPEHQPRFLIFDTQNGKQRHA